MKRHVICLAGPEDAFTPAMTHDDAVMAIQFGVPGHPDAVSSSVPDVLASHGLVPPRTAIDLLNASVAAYTADVRAPRKEAYDRWTRDLALYLPVQEPDRWEAAAPDLEDLLRFLTGDYWTVSTRPAPTSFQPLAAVPPRRPRQVSRLDTSTASLFSGGTDSYIGAIDELSRGAQVALVGHHSLGAGPTSRSQAGALAALRAGFAEERSPFLQFWVSPPKGATRKTELTTRGRSIMFLGLGIAVASGLESGRLVIPENGLISLNVPLTESRLGSFSTRTTHPHLVDLLRRILDKLGINVAVELPYRFATKGEMIRDCADPGLAAAGFAATMSCAHPGAGRFRERDSNRHCGRCLPCLIRRAAAKAALPTDPTPYTAADLSQPLGEVRGSDLRTVRMALERLRQRPPTLADVLAAGPLPGTASDLEGYLGVYQRGMQEVRQFVEGFA